MSARDVERFRDFFEQEDYYHQTKFDHALAAIRRELFINNHPQRSRNKLRNNTTVEEFLVKFSRKKKRPKDERYRKATKEEVDRQIKYEKSKWFAMVGYDPSGKKTKRRRGGG